MTGTGYIETFLPSENRAGPVRDLLKPPFEVLCNLSLQMCKSMVYVFLDLRYVISGESGGFPVPLPNKSNPGMYMARVSVCHGLPLNGAFRQLTGL